MQTWSTFTMIDIKILHLTLMSRDVKIPVSGIQSLESSIWNPIYKLRNQVF